MTKTELRKHKFPSLNNAPTLVQKPEKEQFCQMPKGACTRSFKKHVTRKIKFLDALF